jgi:hypothetical protein
LFSHLGLQWDLGIAYTHYNPDFYINQSFGHWECLAGIACLSTLGQGMIAICSHEQDSMALSSWLTADSLMIGAMKE